MGGVGSGARNPPNPRMDGGSSMTRRDWPLMAALFILCAAVVIVLGPLTGDMP